MLFNGGKTLDLYVIRANAPPKIMMNTLISGCVSGVISAFAKSRLLGTYSFVSRYDCIALCGGFLTGLVAVTGCCNFIEPWAAFIIGSLSSFVYVLGCKVLQKFKIDDPVEASAIYLFGGVWGTIATSLFHNQKGFLYPGKSTDKWTFFWVQILGMISIALWIMITCIPFFMIMKKLKLLRIDPTIELIGLDFAEMGGLSEEVY